MQQLGVGAGPQDLDRDRAAEARVAGPVHLAHGARAQAAHHLVGADARSGREGVCHGAAPTAGYHAAPGGRDGAPPLRGHELGGRGPGLRAAEVPRVTDGSGACCTSQVRPVDLVLQRLAPRAHGAHGDAPVPTTITPRGSSRNVRYQLRGFRLQDRTKTRPRTTTAQIPMTRWGRTAGPDAEDLALPDARHELVGRTAAEASPRPCRRRMVLESARARADHRRPRSCCGCSATSGRSRIPRMREEGQRDPHPAGDHPDPDHRQAA